MMSDTGFTSFSTIRVHERPLKGLKAVILVFCFPVFPLHYFGTTLVVIPQKNSEIRSCLSKNTYIIKLKEKGLTVVAGVCNSEGEGWYSGARSSPNSQNNRHIAFKQASLSSKLLSVSISQLHFCDCLTIQTFYPILWLV